MIEGVITKKLDIIPDERGAVYHMLRADDPIFKKFGEIYFSTAYPGVVKGWHLHKRITQNYAVLMGMIKLVLYDNRSHSATKGELMELFIGDLNYQLVSIPPNVWNGWKAIGNNIAMVANCATEPYDPNEIKRSDPIKNAIPYDWGLKWK